MDPAHTILLAVFLPLHGGGIRGVPVAAGAHRPQLEPDYGGTCAALLPVPCQVACGDKAGTADSGICICIVLVLRPGVRRVHSAPAGHYHLLPGAQCTGRAGRGGGAAAIFHGDPQLCLAGVFGAGRGCFRNAAGQPGLLVRLALLPDAARHER